jgi:hypothetical protein
MFNVLKSFPKENSNPIKDGLAKLFALERIRSVRHQMPVLSRVYKTNELKHLKDESALDANKAIALTPITTQGRNVQNKLWFY